jgi:hypothetical protein
MKSALAWMGPGVFLLLMAAQSAWAQPVNDNFPGTTLSGASLTTTGTNVGATAQLGEPNPVGASGSRSVWWSWTAPASGTVTITTGGSTFDTTLGVYTGALVNSLTPIVENDDGPVDLTSRVQFSGASGTVYRIQVNGFLGDTGSIMLNISGPAVPGSTAWLTSPPSPVVPGALFTVSWSVSGGSASHTNVHWGTSIPPMMFTSTIQSGGPGNFSDTLTAPASPGTWYYQVHAVIGGIDDFSTVAAVTVLAGTPPPSNDDFPGLVLSGLGISTGGTNVGSTAEPGEPNPTGLSGGTSVWWSWTAPSTGLVTINTGGSDFDTTLGVYTGSAVNSLVLVAENDDVAFSFASEVTFMAVAGTDYAIQVNGFLGEFGNITLSIGPTPVGGSGGGSHRSRCGSFGIDLMIPVAFLWLVRRARRWSRAC